VDSERAHPAKRLSQQRFGQYAQGYVTSQTHAAAEELRRLVEMADPQPDWWVLDIATGGGHTALAFAPRVRRVVASDLTGPMLASAREHARQSAGEAFGRMVFHQADAEALPYRAGSFHLVTCRIAPHHFPDAPAFVRECARVLKPGGALVVQDHLQPEDEPARAYIDAFERLRDPSHQRAFSQTEWVALFTGAGLTVTQVDKVLKQHAFLPFAERQGCTPEVIADLARMLREAPEAVRQWRNPRGFEGDLAEAVFSDWHVLIAGQKPHDAF
jgi:ubiquinone/menaquinone biosynthesis C-methylase UbiE